MISQSRLQHFHLGFLHGDLLWRDIEHLLQVRFGVGDVLLVDRSLGF